MITVAFRRRGKKESKTAMGLKQQIEDKLKITSVDLPFGGKVYRVPCWNFEGANYPGLYDDSLINLLQIKPMEKVLDIGGGHNPFKAAQVIIEGYPESGGHHRMGQKVVMDNRVVIGLAEKLPFPDKSFDFVFSRHTFEHIPDIESTLQEMMRVGRRGFFEVPTRWYEYLMGHPTHLWLIDKIGDKIHFQAKPYIQNPMGYVLYHPWTVNIQFRALLELYFRNLFFVQYYWEDKFEFSVDRTGGVNLNDPQVTYNSHMDFVASMLKQAETFQRVLPELEFLDEKFPGNPTVLDTLGVAHFVQGKYQEAREYFLKALGFQPENPQFKEHLKQTESALAKKS